MLNNEIKNNRKKKNGTLLLNKLYRKIEITQNDKIRYDIRIVLINH